MIAEDAIAHSSRSDRRSAWWLDAPAWAQSLVGEKASQHRLDHDLGLTIRESATWRLLTARLGGSKLKMDHAASMVYRELTSRLGDWSPARFWNFIPEIHAPVREGLDRYRAFNVGRHAALMDWYGSEEAFVRLLPTATGVGHDGRELAVHCLACEGSRTGIENPRQRPAYRYSARYGPVGPSFARATVVRGAEGDMLIVGGTASVRGEDSLHEGDTGAQLGETLSNLRTLIAHAAGGDEDDALTRLLAVRVYFARPEDRGAIESRLGEAFGHVKNVEYIRADICRPELLVEIEGVARLDEAKA